MARNTSYQAQRAYEERNGYSRHVVMIRKEIYESFKQKLNGKSTNEILVTGIKEYIEKGE